MSEERDPLCRRRPTVCVRDDTLCESEEIHCVCQRRETHCVRGDPLCVLEERDPLCVLEETHCAVSNPSSDGGRQSGGPREPLRGVGKWVRWS